jgi:hypothetical protein
LRAAWADVRSVSARPRGQLVEALRRLYGRRRLVAAASGFELRLGSRRGHAIDTRGLAELLLASRVLEDRPAQRREAA